MRGRRSPDSWPGSYARERPPRAPRAAIPRAFALDARPVDELVHAAREARPRILGIGVTMREQLDDALAIAERVATELGSDAPRVLLGGAALRGGAALPAIAHATVCDDFRSVLAMVRATGGQTRA